MRFERTDLFFGQASSEPRHDKAFKPQADVKSIARFFPGGRRDSGPAIAPQFHESFGRKLTQSAAHDRAACAETLADRVFRKFRARGERLLDDRVAERSIDRPCSISVGFCLRPGHGSEFPLREPF
jgi:hypothetical protein